MRNTVEVDNDTPGRVEAVARRRGVEVGAVVNEALRIGLERIDAPAVALPYRTQAHPLGLQPGVNLDNIQELLSRMEGEASR
jgi:hypothetical protein